MLILLLFPDLEHNDIKYRHIHNFFRCFPSPQTFWKQTWQNYEFYLEFNYSYSFDLRLGKQILSLSGFLPIRFQTFLLRIKVIFKSHCSSISGNENFKINYVGGCYPFDMFIRRRNNLNWINTFASKVWKLFLMGVFLSLHCTVSIQFLIYPLHNLNSPSLT